MTQEMKLPIVDMTAFRGGGTAGKATAAADLAEAFEGTGFAIITGHGVSEPLAQNTYDEMTAFFDLPLADKMIYSPPEKAKGRGYLPMGIESVAKTLSGETPPDLCEALVFSNPHRPESDAHNYWPEKPLGVTGLVRDWTSEMTRLVQDMVRLSALALDLPEDYFSDAFADPSMTLRFVHYPDQEEEPAPGQLRYGEHHDYGALTILRQDSAPGGLEIRDDDGVWKEAPVVQESFVINVGDLMARWTNNRWQSTLHRVSNPARNLTGSTRRLSMVTFMGPHQDWEVSCLPSCQSADNPPQYEPVTCGDFFIEKLSKSMELSKTD